MNLFFVFATEIFISIVGYIGWASTKLKLENEMSKIINTVAAITLALSVGVVGANAKEYRGINERQKNQQERIAQGLKSGDLSNKEAVKLEKQQIQIAKTEKRMRADDGGLSLKERARLDNMQDHSSRQIHKQRND